jgi:magnesium chelatase family protein
MNPCPCGWYGDASSRCRCTPDQVRRYRGRISGPLLDRIDLVVEVPAPPADAMALDHARLARESPAVRDKVIEARRVQHARQRATNARLTARDVASHCALADAPQRLLARALSRHSMSARAYHRIAKVARTIADLAGTEAIDVVHVAEALSFRLPTGERSSVAA